MALFSPVTIEDVPPQARARALQFLLAESLANSPSRGLDAAISGEQLIWACADDRILGATWAEVTTPGTVMIVIPRLAKSAGAGIREKLLCEMDRGLAEEGHVRLAQVLLGEGDWANAPWLASCGFQSLTHIDFLVAFASPVESASRLSLQRVGPQDHDRFRRLVQQTDSGTQDCPELDDWRRAIGVHYEYGVAVGHHDDCYFVQYDGRDVGALVLQRDVGVGRCGELLEIRYLGVCPDDRRRGFASAALRTVRQVAAQEGRMVVTTVDRANVPAHLAYAAAGFRAWDRRILWGKRFAAPGEAKSASTK